jgi:hypothetical protein
MATETAAEEDRRAEFERVMRYATERAWNDGTEEEVMAALFDVLNGATPSHGRTEHNGPVR